MRSRGRYHRGPMKHRRPPRGPAPAGRGRLERAQPRASERHPPHEDALVFGVEPVRELISAAPSAIRALRVRAGDAGRFAAEIAAARAAGARVEFVEESELARLAGRDARHQGIAAAMREYNYAALDDVIAARPDPIVIVDGVTDPRNLGALMRSAEGAGVRAIVLARDRTASVTPAAIKSSAGAWVHLAIARCGNVASTLERLKEAGYWVAALAPRGGTSIYDLDTSRKLAIVVGSEGAGVRDIVRRTADFVVDIPMRGKVDSLNVSVAAAVALFEIARRRTGGAPAS
jgi:23S rRNA (guanosine2251-2'-O)-methyltransferase